MTKERELLEETLLFLDEFEYPTIVEEIRAFLAAEKEAEELVIMTVGQIADAFDEEIYDWQSFIAGVKTAENYHKIGGRNE